MKLLLLAIGKKHNPKIAAAIKDYTDRLDRYYPINWQLVDAKSSASLPEERLRDEESRQLLRFLRPEDVVILLDERGAQLKSTDLAKKIQIYANQGKKRLVFVIGGAYGVNKEFRQEADVVWSLSKLVFPHQLVRLILVEQLYRSCTINAGEKYHHQ